MGVYEIFYIAGCLITLLVCAYLTAKNSKHSEDVTCYGFLVLFAIAFWPGVLLSLLAYFFWVKLVGIFR